MPIDPSGTPVPSEHCKSCATVNRAGARFCRKCGASMTGPPAVGPLTASVTNSLGGADGATACCPNCDAPARPGARFCGKCGLDLLDSSRDRNWAGDAATLDLMECPACGAQVTVGSVVCSACGLTLDLVEDENGNLLPPEQSQEEADPEEESSEISVPPSTIDSLDGKCIACGTPLNDDDNSCPSCGLNYGPCGNERDEAGLAYEPELVLCPSCGIPTDAETRRCPQCGRSLSIALGLD